MSVAMKASTAAATTRTRPGAKEKGKGCVKRVQTRPRIATKAAADAGGVQVQTQTNHRQVLKALVVVRRSWRKVQEGIVLGTLFGSWYVFNIAFNIYNKQALQVFPYPATCTAAHVAVGALVMLFLWSTNIKKKPGRISKSTWTAVWPLAFLHSAGFLTTNISLGSVAVSFTHTIKALEPFFSVMLSWSFLGTMPSPAVVASLLPIVGGVVLASVSEASFNWTGFVSAMGSNLAFQSRNVLSKRYMQAASLDSSEMGGENCEALDNLNLFAVMTMCATLILFPAAMLLEGFKFLPGTVTPKLLWQIFAAGLCRAGDVLVSYLILSRVSPVTHSVGNCIKRVAVIVISIIFFKTNMNLMSKVGTSIALAGVGVYTFTLNQVKARKSRAVATVSTAPYVRKEPTRPPSPPPKQAGAREPEVLQSELELGDDGAGI